MIRSPKKWLALLLAVLFALSLAPSALAEEGEEEELFYAESSGPLYFTSLSPDTIASDLNSIVDVSALRARLLEQMLDHESKLLIYPDFRIPYEHYTLVFNFIRYCMPEAPLSPRRSMGSEMRTTQNGEQFLESVVFPYMMGSDSAEICRADHEALNAAAEELLRGVKGNDALSDVDKALLLHDRLAVWVEYDYEHSVTYTVPERSGTAYGALASHLATCQGYVLAYRYLLDQVGVESALCDSESLNHIWNIVTVNGNGYHVDVTWDDPVRTNREKEVISADTTGRLRHTNFLLSTDTLQNNPNSQPHTATDFDTRPQSTDYENAWWIGVETAIQYASGAFWYIEPDGDLVRREGDSVSAVLTVDSVWPDGKNYAKLSGANRYLLYSTPNSIVEYDTKTGDSRIVFTPDLSEVGDGAAIYGFTYYENTLVCQTAPASGGANAVRFVEFRAPYSVPGDFTGDDEITAADAIYVLYSTFYPDDYPLNQSGEFTGDADVTAADAIHLLYYTFYPDDYPLPVPETLPEPDPVQVIPRITSPLTRAQLEAIPVATPDMTEDELRSICRQYMRLMVNVVWTPDETLLFQYPSANASDENGNLHLNYGTRYSGVPYSQAAANLESFLDYYDEETGVLALSEVGTDISTLFGNNCGTSLFWAWQRVSSTINYFGTRQMTLKHGCIPVGTWTYDTTLSTFSTPTTREIAQENGRDVMFESYAALKPADGMVVTLRDSSGTLAGHARMVDEVHVVYNTDGSINGSKSYVLCIEQASSGLDRVTEDGEVQGIGSYQSRYTFSKLYSGGYAPVTIAELCGESAVQKAAASFTPGTDASAAKAFLAGEIRTNYCISRADITFTSPGEATVTAFRQGSCKTAEQYKMKMSDLVSSDRFGELKKGVTYSVSITLRLGNGETLEMEPFDLKVPAPSSESGFIPR